MTKIFFVSDNHFSHKNILNFCPNTRVGRSVEQMNRIMIQNWQEQVGMNDIVWTLGDVFFCNAAEAINIMHQLPGRKHLVYGNHDKVIRSNSVLRGLFEAVHEYKEIEIEGQKVVLFHYPMYEWNRMQRGAFHLYGHVHGDITVKNAVTGRALDVGIDGALSTGEMKLYPWEDVKRYLDKKEIRGHHNKVIL